MANGGVTDGMGNGTDCKISRRDFPHDFVFGAASSAYQYEGGAKEGGRGPSVWDTFTQRNPGKVKDGTNGNIAVDSYRLYKEDVMIIKKMGLDAYRFSISWSRVLPGGNLSGPVNREGIKYYNDLINELLANGIEPYVTLFHWDLPQALEDEYGGFLSPRIIADFCEFAELCFWEFGDRVKNWITLNEPYTYSVGGYVMGTTPPGRGASASDHVEGSYPPSQSIHCKHQQNCDGDPGTEPYLATHYQLLAHAAAVKLYREKFQTPQGGKIGITLVSKWMEPLDESSDLDVKASLRALDWFFGWFMEPITTGDYPQSMKEYVGSRLPKFTKLQSEMLRGSFDFLGLNYYTANYVSHGLTSDKGLLSYNTDPQVTYAIERNGKPIGPPSASDWLSVYPEGMQKLLVYIKKTYKDPLIYITENGVDETNNVSLTVSEALNDTTRTEFLQDHLFYLRKAMDDDVNVKGYFMWSLLDNFEWNDGYSVRFGLVHVDYSNGYARHPKASAVWLMNFLRQGTNRRVVPQYSESRTISRDSEDFDASHESSSEDLPGLVQRTTKYPTTPSQDADEVLIEQDHHVTPPSKMDEDGLNETGNNAAMQIDDHQTLVQPPSDEPTQEKEATEASPSTTIPITVEPERSTQVNEPGELRAEEIQNEPVASVPVPEDSVPTQQVVTKDRRFTATVKRRIKSVSSKVKKIGSRFTPCVAPKTSE